MTSSTTSSGRKKIWENRYQWFLAIALLALMTEMSLSSVKARRIISALLIAFALTLLGYENNAFAADTHNLVSKGIKAYDQKNYDAALKSFIDAQLQAPDNDLINFNIGAAYYKSGDFQKALSHFEQAAASKNVQLRDKAIFNKGNSQFRLQQYKDAIDSYKTYLKTHPEDSKASANLQLAEKMLEQQKQRKQQQSDQNKKDQQQQNNQKQPNQQQEGADQNRQQQSQKNGNRDQSQNSSQNKNGNGNKEKQTPASQS